MTTKAKSRKPQATKGAHILVRYACHDGLISYKVVNGEKKHYCCTKHLNGTWMCIGDDKEQCKGHKYSEDHTCYHIEACQQAEAEHYLAECEQAAFEADMQAYRAEAMAEKERIASELVLYQAEMYAAEVEKQQRQTSASAVIESEHVDSSTAGTDPWEGLDPEQRWQAWRNYELGMSGLAV